MYEATHIHLDLLYCGLHFGFIIVTEPKKTTGFVSTYTITFDTPEHIVQRERRRKMLDVMHWVGESPAELLPKLSFNIFVLTGMSIRKSFLMPSFISAAAF
jgi:hypothetical protein